MDEMTCATYLLERLQTEDAKYVFRMRGGGADELSNSFWNFKDLKFILVNHEQNGTFDREEPHPAIEGLAKIVTGK